MPIVSGKRWLITFVFSLHVSAAEVLFVSPSSPEDPFFSRVELYSRIAARSLGLKMETIYGGGHRIYQHEELRDRLQDTRPDYLVLQVYSGSGEALFELLSRYPDVRVVTLERLLLADEAKMIGRPGQRYESWIGEIYFDNKVASKKLSQFLFSRCARQAELDRPGVVGLNGFHGYEAESREAGLQQAVDAQTAFRLHQVVNAKWQRELAQQQTVTLMQRYPDTSVFWSASDWMALGVADSLTHQGVKQKFCVGGFDWLPLMLEAIYHNRVDASIGGHFLIGAWAMVMISDHFHHSQQTGKGYTIGSVNLEMGLVSHENVENVTRIIQPEFWKQVDFEQFSRRATQTDGYDFSLERLMTLLSE